ncbi:MAG: arsenate reductase family protein [Polyangiales bacterium]
MSIVLYHYCNCGTCKKARAFLEEQGIDVTLRDIVANAPSAVLLRKIQATAGLPIRKLFNTSGVSYREGGYKDKLPTMSDDEAFRALAADGKLIKRPLVIGDGFALVGFKEDEWREAFRL